MTGKVMSTRVHDATEGARADGERNRYILGAAHGLQLAAAPTFAIMALLTAAAGDGASDILCAAARMRHR